MKLPIRLFLTSVALSACVACPGPPPEEGTVTVTVRRGGAGTGSISSSPSGIDCGETCAFSVQAGTSVTLTASPATGSTFDGWTGPCTGADPCTFTPTSDTTVDAQFSVAKHALTVSLTGNGTGVISSVPAAIDCGTTCGAQLDHGTAVTLTATASEGSSFVGWTGGGCSGTGACVVTLTSDTTVQAAFALDVSLVVTLAGNGSGVVSSDSGTINCGAQCSSSVPPGTTVTLTATPANDSTFTGWSGVCSGMGECVVTLDQSKMVTATFALEPYALTVTKTGSGAGAVTSSPAGISCGATCVSSFDSGTAVTLSATASDGSTFVGWSGAGCTGTTPCTVTVTAATTVDATFDSLSVSSVTSSTADGSYASGATVSIQVLFTSAVVVTGTPTLALNSGGTATYQSGSGTSALSFTYTVAAGDVSGDLDYASSSALALSGGAISDAAGSMASLTLPTPGQAGSLGANKAIVIDTQGPTVINVSSSTANGSYTAGASITIQVAFNESVEVMGVPSLALNSGGFATYASGSGTSTLVFSYAVAGGNSSADLDYTSTSALAGGTIKDAAGNNAVLTLPAPGATGSLGANNAIVIDTQAPTVINVTSSTGNGTYGAGTSITIQVAFDEPVAVIGTPTLALNSGATVAYASGSGTSTLTFIYTVLAGNSSADLDYTSTSALSGGTIMDAAGNNAVRTLPAPGAAGSLGANKTIVIDTQAPTVINVSSPTVNGSYSAGASITIQVTFSEPVVVIGTPTLALNSGAIVNYTSGSGTSTLTFIYTVLAGNSSADLDYTSTSALTAGTAIKDAAGNNAVLTLPSPGALGSLAANKNIVIDTQAPTVNNVSSTPTTGTFNAGDSITIQVTFSEPVVVSGTPTLALNSGATVAYSSGSGSTTLAFIYTVVAGNSSPDLDYTSTSALTAGTAIKDVAGNNAVRTLPPPGAAGSLGANDAIVIDTQAPTVTNVSSSTPNGSYTAGASIPIQIAFNEPVIVTGTPTLILNSGGFATYSSGSGSTTLSFIYLVGSGDSSADLDYSSTSALTGGSLNDIAGNPANRLLPAPGTFGSLGANKNIVIF